MDILKLSFALLLLLYATSIFSLPLARTIVTSINVRAAPTEKVTATLPGDKLVGVISVKDDWAYIAYTLNDKSQTPRFGWVSHSKLRYLDSSQLPTNHRITPRIDGDSCKLASEVGRACVTLTNEFLTCIHDYTGIFYKSCEAELDYDVATEYTHVASMNIEIMCEAEIEYEVRGSNWSLYDSDSASHIHSLAANVTVNNAQKFNFEFDLSNRVNRVNINSATCLIQGIYQYPE